MADLKGAVHPLLAEALRHHQAGRLAEADALYRRLLAEAPDDVDALHFHGVLLRRLKRPDQAVARLVRVIALSPGFADAHYNLGNALRDMGRLDEAAQAFRQATLCRPDFDQAHALLGDMLQLSGRLEEAVASYGRALAGDPARAATHYSLGTALQRLGRLEEAIAAFGRAVALDPGHVDAVTLHHFTRQHACDWAEWEARQARISGLVAGGHKLSPFIVLAQRTDTATQLAAARNWAAHKFGHLASWRDRLGLNHRPGPRERLAIGYLSADFHEHATSLLMAELFDLHDRAGFHVSAYSYGPDDGSALRRRIVAACDRFVDLRAADTVAAARRIDADGIDILVDLKGYTSGARTEIVALRPAPVQVNWLGYPGTMGADFIDWIVVDPFLAVAGPFAEKTLVLPDCYQINDRRRAVAEDTPSRAECGLPDEALVLAAFNGTYKITPEVFEAWMRLMKAVPGAVLWQIQSNPLAVVTLKREAAARGVDPGRLVFAPAMPPARHLARYRLADLALDTFPVNGHTTTSDALWMGCPVVTLAGNTLVSRVAGSLLRTVGLGDLVTTSLAEYEALALRLASTRAVLAEVRGRLAANRNSTPLFDSRRFTAQLEAGYRMIWEEELKTRMNTDKHG